MVRLHRRGSIVYPNPIAQALRLVGWLFKSENKQENAVFNKKFFRIELILLREWMQKKNQPHDNNEIQE